MGDEVINLASLLCSNRQFVYKILTKIIIIPATIIAQSQRNFLKNGGRGDGSLFQVRLIKSQILSQTLLMIFYLSTFIISFILRPPNFFTITICYYITYNYFLILCLPVFVIFTKFIIKNITSN